MHASMNDRFVVFVNHWGGVPRAVQGNLTSMQAWADEEYHEVHLSTTNGENEYKETTRVLWKTLREHGFHVVVLGATGYGSENTWKRFTEDTLPDPRLEHSESHCVDVTSLHDGAEFDGPASIHDALVLEEATQMVRCHSGSKPLALCVNLLSCRDVVRTRFGNTSTRCLRRCCTAVATSQFDPRWVPSSINVSLAQISGPFSDANSKPFGEAGRPVRPGEYATLLQRSLSILDSLQRSVMSFLTVAIAHGAQVCMMATRSLSLGEHSCRGENIPITACSNSFWCSTCPQMTTEETSIVFTDLLHRFVHRTCHVPLYFSFLYRPLLCTTLPATGETSTEPFFRVGLMIHGHRYVCIGKGAHLLYVFDIDDDPHEESDIRSSLAHVQPKLLVVYRGCVGAPSQTVSFNAPRLSATTTRFPLPTTANGRSQRPPPSASSPPAPSRPPPVLLPPSPPETLPPHATLVFPPAPEEGTLDENTTVFHGTNKMPLATQDAYPRKRSTRRTAATSTPSLLRAKETELNKMHR